MMMAFLRTRLRVPDAVQRRLTMHRRAGTHCTTCGPRNSSAPLRAGQHPGNAARASLLIYPDNAVGGSRPDRAVRRKIDMQRIDVVDADLRRGSLREHGKTVAAD